MMNFNPISEFGLDVLDKFSKVSPKYNIPYLNNNIKLLTTSGKPLPMDSILGEILDIQKYAGGGYGYRNPKIINDVLLQNREMDFAKKAASEGLKNAGKNAGTVGKIVRAGKVGVEFIPYLGDIYDIGSGGYQALHGHPFVGTGQALLGGAGLAANILFPGSGTVGKTAAKAGLKGLVKGAQVAGKEIAQETPKLAKAIRDYARINRSAGGQLATGIVPEILYALSGNDNEQKIEQPIVSQEEKTSEELPKLPEVALPYNGNYSPDSIETMLKNLPPELRYDGGIDDLQPINDIDSSTNDIQQPTSNIDDLLKFYREQQQYMEPYKKGLEELINNYEDLQRQAFNRDRYLAGIAGWSGNNNFANMIGKYNPAQIEASRLDLINKLAQANIGEQQGEQNIKAMASAMQQYGMPVDMALVDPSMIGKLSNVMSAQTAAEARKYVADRNYKAKALDTYLDNMIKLELAKGNWANAKYLQGMKNANKLETTYMQQLPWTTDYNALNNAMLQFGYPINTVIQPQVIQSQDSQVSQPQDGQTQSINYGYKDAFKNTLGK